ncbi:hypothetical protein PENSPDRAFT_634639 [Peniophora sp. CONT]|nr:hypothetical protein PENSPDRAFT_634639 [Peniophora sp. CONT]
MSSGTALPHNPLNELLDAVGNDALLLQARYEEHRIERNAQQAAIMTSPSFPGVTVDTILQKLIDHTLSPPYLDERNAGSLWARPPRHILDLLGSIQHELSAFAPRLWLMPLDHVHLSLVELGHHMTVEANLALIAHIEHHLPDLISYARLHPTRLYRPTISCDTGSLVLKFLPMAETKDDYTYHHLRRDIFDRVSETGLVMKPRYVVPSAHLTVARFIDNVDFETDGHTDENKMKEWWGLIDRINARLERELDSRHGGQDEDGMWLVEKVECRYGAQWYGGGQSWHPSTTSLQTA